ncbi:hypothetical protein MKP05_09360 [Halomonas sp. EGI 63088]|uniref:Cadherin domain-containing protein n=1 Tax=Halomonas flagellata TaxID=2920385 RepID=A0ABS9RU10_9GAMM|nr:hypothetical protein [Halomonas flagellata]MCH4563336.1 hypothetical protein [Halomonas flagellata]
MAWKWYTDSGLTTEFSGIKQLVHLADLSDNPQDFILYYAEIEEDVGDNGILVQQAYSNPGTDPINTSIVDDAPSSGHAADEVTLALTAAELDTNTAGASLTISSVDSDYGESLFSGASNVVEVHVRVENAVTAVSDSTELKLHIVDVVDSEVSSGS